MFLFRWLFGNNKQANKYRPPKGRMGGCGCYQPLPTDGPIKPPPKKP